MAAKRAELEKHEAKLAAESKQMRDAEAAAQGEQPQAQAADRQTKRPERNVAQDKQASGAMVTVALRGESAQRLRALAAAQQLSLSKLLVRMMEVFEAQAAG